MPGIGYTIRKSQHKKISHLRLRREHAILIGMMRELVNRPLIGRLRFAFFKK